MVASISGVTFSYPGGAAPTLREVSLEVRGAELLLLSGPSGAGKSTLLRLLLGLVPQRTGGRLEGRVRVLGIDPTTRPPAAVAAAGVALAYQEPLEGAVAERVAEEVAFGPENLGLAPEEIDARVESALGAVGMRGTEGRRLRELSAGERQRVALAAVLALRPRLLLLDEPTAHLDDGSAREVIDLLRRLRAGADVTIVLAEQRMELAAAVADRVAILAEGELRLVGDPRTVLADPALREWGARVPSAVALARAAGLREPLPLAPEELVERLRAEETPLPAAALGSSPRARRAGDGAEVARATDVSYRYGPARADSGSAAHADARAQHGARSAPGGASANALEGIDIAVRAGEIVGLVGPSGSGKTTLARLLVGLRRPTSGVVRLGGRPTTELSAAAHAATAGLVLQNPLLQLLGESVREDVLLGLRHLPATEAGRRCDAALERFGLSPLRERHPLSLSEGERRRVVLAGVVARRPRLLVLDEPSIGQDARQLDALADLLLELAADGTAILVATHDPELLASTCDRVAVLRAGRLGADLPLRWEPAQLGELDRAGVPLTAAQRAALLLERARGDHASAERSA